MTALYRHNFKFRLMVWLALLAVLWPAAVPVLHHAGIRPMLGYEHICSSTKPSADADTKKAQVCPVCQSLAHIAHGYVPPDNIELGKVYGASFVENFADAQKIIALDKTTSAWPHAPPSLA